MTTCGVCVRVIPRNPSRGGVAPIGLRFPSVTPITCNSAYGNGLPHARLWSALDAPSGNWSVLTDIAASAGLAGAALVIATSFSLVMRDFYSPFHWCANAVQSRSASKAEIDCPSTPAVRGGISAMEGAVTGALYRALRQEICRT